MPMNQRLEVFDDPVSDHLAESSSLVVVEGFHAIKHILRFGGDVVHIFSSDVSRTHSLARSLAPDLVGVFLDRTCPISSAVLRKHAKQDVHTRTIGLARLPGWTLAEALPTPTRPAVLLENPQNQGNIGAVVRVAKAAGASGVILVGGDRDPFTAGAVRGAAGLQFALPTVASALEDLGGHHVVLFSDQGERFDPASLPQECVFAYGTERDGATASLCDRADQIVSLPMADGVSSLNLATAVAASLYLHRYHVDAGEG